MAGEASGGGGMSPLVETAYETVIGLEVHVQLKTRTKMFCGCAIMFGAAPNTQVCPVCLGLPGALPATNARAAELAVLAGLALNCEMAEESVFARKNYFYPDLPKGYQISQFDRPVCGKGWLDIPLRDGMRRVGITRAHLEEDAGKLVHTTAGMSLVDLNRAGVPLLEVVSEPELWNSEEAYAYLVTLKALLQYAGVSDCDMEKGSLRCDANISIRPSGATALGTKVEIKNLNSFKAVKAALEFEAARQVKALESGERLVQETRLWDDDHEATAPMRSKEGAHDYRYFPEPDLPPLRVSREMVDRIRAGLPELPAARRARFISRFGLSEYDSGVLTADRAVADYFEAVLAAGAADAKAAANWIMSELLGALNAAGKEIGESPVSPAALAELVKLIADGTLSGKLAKQVFAEMAATGQGAVAIVKAKNLVQVTDAAALAPAIEAALAASPESVAAYRAGKAAALGRLVGEVMKRTQGKANPQAVNRFLEERLRKEA